jgi:hypothetical protein
VHARFLALSSAAPLDARYRARILGETVMRPPDQFTASVDREITRLETRLAEIVR